MRIGYLADARSVHTHRWVGYFAENGHEVSLITLKPFYGDGLQNVRLHEVQVVRSVGRLWIPLMVRRINLPWVALQVRHLVKRIKPDLLHAHSVTDYGLFAALCGFHPFVVTAWGSDVLIAAQRSALLRRGARLALRRADALTCDATHLIESMVKLGAPRGRISLVFFGTDTRKFSPQRRDDRFKLELGLEPDAPTVISLRSLNPIYDIESLVRAIPRVVQEVAGAKFIVAGDGEQREYLEQLSQSLGVTESVKFVGLVPNHELPRYLASSDVYVSTSLSDAGLAASTAEAMACELPVVITDFGNNGDWVKEGQGGFLVPLKNPAALADKILYLLKSEQARRKFGKINRRVIEERNNYYREMAKVEAIYRKLIEEQSS